MDTCIEEEDHDTNLYQDKDDANLEQHCCGSCMDCLGLSWSDFM